VDVDDEDESAAAATSLFDDAADEADEDEEDEEEDEQAEDDLQDAVMEDVAVDAADDVASSALVKPRLKARNRNVILDDDDDDESEKPLITTVAAPTPTRSAPTQAQTSPFEAFGFAMPKADVSLTQMFQGTMADLATREDTAEATPGNRSLRFLRDVPVPTLPTMSPAILPTGLLVEDSQSALATPAKQQNMAAATPRFTPQFLTPMAVGSQMSPTKLSDIPEPTQDAGFDSFRRSTSDVPFSTVDTVMIPVSESPVAQKKGKLRRRPMHIAQLSDDEAAANDHETSEKEEEFELTTNAFDALFKAAKKPAQSETFDKKRSEAKNMFEEQAEESEDEYAGLGGASDDESDNGIDEEVQKMIDEGPVDVKEGELQKLFAEKDLADNEKGIDKLYRDITTGGLRKRKAVGVDELSDDSDDEAQERMRQKQREFAKMRKALLEDENLGKIGNSSLQVCHMLTLTLY
jgi:mediator of replication checkpoint protein 1